MKIVGFRAVIAHIVGVALGLWTGLALAGSDAGLFDGATRLVMVDDAGCVYCAKWDREVGPGYVVSPEGQFAPLKRLRIGSSDLNGIGQLAYTPTFVLIVRGQEAGRIVGYAGADFFWGEVDRLYAKAGFRPNATPPQLPPNDRAELAGPLVHVADN